MTNLIALANFNLKPTENIVICNIFAAICLHQGEKVVVFLKFCSYSAFHCSKVRNGTKQVQKSFFFAEITLKIMVLTLKCSQFSPLRKPKIDDFLEIEILVSCRARKIGPCRSKKYSLEFGIDLLVFIFVFEFFETGNL